MKKIGDKNIRGKSKREVFEEWMKTDHILLQVDSRKDGVSLPVHLMHQPHVTLKLSYLFQGKTTHDEAAITSFLKFSGNYFECILPWPAVWGMVSSEGPNVVWPEDVPKEIVIQAAKEKVMDLGKRLLGKSDATTKPKIASLKVAAERPADPSPQVSEGAGPEKKELPATPHKDRSFLKRIK